MKEGNQFDDAERKSKSRKKVFTFQAENLQISTDFLFRMSQLK